MTLTIVFFVGDTTRSAKLKPIETNNKITQKIINKEPSPTQTTPLGDIDLYYSNLESNLNLMEPCK